MGGRCCRIRQLQLGTPPRATSILSRTHRHLDRLNNEHVRKTSKEGRRGEREMVNAGLTKSPTTVSNRSDAHPRPLFHIHLFNLDGGGVGRRRFSIRHRSPGSSGAIRPSPFASRRCCEARNRPFPLPLFAHSAPLPAVCSTTQTCIAYSWALLRYSL